LVERTWGEVKDLARLVTGLLSRLADIANSLWACISFDGRLAKGDGISSSAAMDNHAPHTAIGPRESASLLSPLADPSLATVFWRPHPPLVRMNSRIAL